MQIPTLHLYMTPTDLIIWLIIGLIAGSLATRIIGGHSYGCIGNIIVAIIGACILIAILRFIARGTHRV